MSRFYQSLLKNKASGIMRLIIFDFDGVLADSFSSFYKLNRDGMKHVGLSFSRKQYRGLFVGNIHQGFRNFINNEKKLKIFSEFREANYDRYYYNKNKRVKLFPKAPKLVKILGNKYILTIASSGKLENIKKLLEKRGIDNFFSLILAGSAYSKERMIREILDKFKIKPEETCFITDTVGDIKVAKKAGLKTIAVTWGFHSKKILAQAKPDKIIGNIEKLLL